MLCTVTAVGVTGSDPAVGGPCTVSHYCPEGTSVPLPCPAGTYNNRTGQANCTACPAGFYCPAGAVTFTDYPCHAGYYCPPGTDNAFRYPCPRGHYRNASLGVSVDDCTPCPGGYYCEGEGLREPTGRCDAGRWRGAGVELSRTPSSARSTAHRLARIASSADVTQQSELGFWQTTS